MAFGSLWRAPAKRVFSKYFGLRKDGTEVAKSATNTHRGFNRHYLSIAREIAVLLVVALAVAASAAVVVAVVVEMISCC